ncbi:MULTISPECIES: hypothetical protein [unclassified Bradyrhizobium]|uniref:hypothetical protein n=1 Tax=unclassified Bradyrhizobium TaxID=2631580 RepID=UPI0028EDE1FD|nr:MULTISPECIES: hypothetical protein [unclassified Bradyrhizobium]
MSNESEKRTFAQSSVAFPYMDLETGISVARALRDAGSIPLSRDQLAAVMKTTPGNGTFLTKLATARTFGLIANLQGKYELLELGHGIVSKDENRQRSARAEAFLTVPLYRRTYDEFKGKELPPKSGLENAFINFGVAPKQAYNARLAFEKSANQAGFFSAGPERLVAPILSSSGSASAGPIGYPQTEIPAVAPKGPPLPWEAGATADPIARAVLGSSHDNGLDQLIVGLLQRLPKAGEKWDTEKRVRWLQTLAANFDMVYDNDDDRVIVVECKSR